MIDAWFSSSENTWAPSAANTSNTERLAANPVGNTTARSHAFHSARDVSSSTCTGREPVIRREAPDPAPQRSSARWAASTTAGWVVNPR